jgi:hypothetical protein
VIYEHGWVSPQGKQPFYSSGWLAGYGDTAHYSHVTPAGPPQVVRGQRLRCADTGCHLYEIIANACAVLIVATDLTHSKCVVHHRRVIYAVHGLQLAVGKPPHYIKLDKTYIYIPIGRL